MVECKLQDVGQECDIEKLLSDHELIGEGKKNSEDSIHSLLFRLSQDKSHELWSES